MSEDHLDPEVRLARTEAAPRPTATPLRVSWPAAIGRHAVADIALLVFAFYLVAAATFSGFFTKWSLRDTDARYGVAAMLDGSARQPFVYRRLLPIVVNAIDRALPSALHERVTAKLLEVDWIGRQYARAQLARDAQYTLRYHLLFFTMFLSLVAALFVLRRLALDAGFDRMVANAGVLIFAPMLTLLATGGGYFYDFPELLFMALAVLWARRGWYVLLLPLAAIATLNKESFLAFCLCLYPLFPASDPIKRRIAWLAAYLLVAAAANFWLKQQFLGNPGVVVEQQLGPNIQRMLNLRSYLDSEINYGILFPRGFNLIYVALGIVLVRRGWRLLPKDIRTHALFALAINGPLFLLFAVFNELRNLSFLFVSMCMIVCGAVQSWRDRASAPGTNPSGGNAHA